VLRVGKYAEGGPPHPKDGDKYTPISPDILAMMWELRDKYGSWREVAAVTQTRLKVLRRFRTGDRHVISMRLMDRILTTTGHGRLDDYVWFTPNDLVAMGIWKTVVPISEQPRPDRDDPQWKQEQREKRRLRKERRAERLRLEEHRRNITPGGGR
jgi:hypothetical protein